MFINQSFLKLSSLKFHLLLIFEVKKEKPRNQMFTVSAEGCFLNGEAEKQTRLLLFSSLHILTGEAEKPNSLLKFKETYLSVAGESFYL